MTLLLQKLGREEAVLTLWNMPDIELQKTEYEYPVDYIISASGIPILTDAIAIVAGRGDTGAACAYYEFVTSLESLALVADLFYRIPSRNDIPSEILPEWMRDLEIPKMEIDWNLVERYDQEWMEYWDNYIRGGP
jgi:iron(III) transport system substrate-binding protein